MTALWKYTGGYAVPDIKHPGTAVCLVAKSEFPILNTSVVCISSGYVPYWFRCSRQACLANEANVRTAGICADPFETPSAWVG